MLGLTCKLDKVIGEVPQAWRCLVPLRGASAWFSLFAAVASWQEGFAAKGEQALAEPGQSSLPCLVGGATWDPPGSFPGFSISHKMNPAFCHLFPPLGCCVA